MWSRGSGFHPNCVSGTSSQALHERILLHRVMPQTKHVSSYSIQIMFFPILGTTSYDFIPVTESHYYQHLCRRKNLTAAWCQQQEVTIFQIYILFQVMHKSHILLVLQSIHILHCWISNTCFDVIFVDVHRWPARVHTKVQQITIINNNCAFDWQLSF